MESCLKKLVLDAPETGFQDAERAERKPLVPPGRELVPGGIHWRQMGVDSLPSGVQKVYSRTKLQPLESQANNQKTSYIMLFCALLLVRNSKATLEQSVRVAPLAGNAKCLAEELLA